MCRCLLIFLLSLATNSQEAKSATKRRSNWSDNFLICLSKTGSTATKPKVSITNLKFGDKAL